MIGQYMCIKRTLNAVCLSTGLSATLEEGRTFRVSGFLSGEEEKKSVLYSLKPKKKKKRHEYMISQKTLNENFVKIEKEEDAT